MIKENQQPALRTGHFYRCVPTLCEANIIGPYLVDLDGTYLQFFSLESFGFIKRLEVLKKEDQYCAQMAVASDNVVVIFGVDKLLVFNVADMAIVETIKIDFYIEKIESRDGFIVALTSEEDSENKVAHCWKLCPKSGKVLEKYKATPFLPSEFEECTEDNLNVSIIFSIEKNPRVYVYWKGTNSMIEIDPIKQQSERYSRQSSIEHVTDLTAETYAEILDNKINVFHKKAGKRIAQLFNENEKFTRIFGDGSKDCIYSTSNLGLKRWKLQVNAEPELYVSSEKYQITQLFFWGQKIVGLNRENYNIVIWENPEVCHAHSFPNEVIRKVIKVDENRVFFLLEATATCLEENDFHVSKYNKLEIYDMAKDSEVAKKAMLQAKYSVDGESIIVKNEGKEEQGNKDEQGVVTIRFIVNEDSQEGAKKYVLKWTPFNKDENQKDTKKKEIKSAAKFDSVRMFPFNRIMGIIKSNQSSFSLFGKENDQKTSLTLMDFGAKKVGEYDFSGDVQSVEISENNRLYTLGSERVSIYLIDGNNKNRLEKINELDIQAVSLRTHGDYLLIRKTDSFLLLDADFECVMREEVDDKDEEYKIIPFNNSSFFLKTEKNLALWNHESETAKSVQAPDCDPSILQLMGGKLIVAEKWVQAYDLNIA